MRKLSVLFLILLSFNMVFGEITIKGDARVRPRLDQRYNEDGKTYQDLYYMYWARLWMDAKLTEGYYFSTKLGADGPGTFIGKFGEIPGDGVPGYSGGASEISGGRGTVRFVEMHFGRKTEKYGYSIGILPMSGLGNPEYDIHFYPFSRSDVPFHIINLSSAAGFRGYYKIGENKLNVTLTLDENTGNREGTGNPRDQYSLFANYEMTVGEFGVAPTLIYTVADEDLEAPITVGANATMPKVAGFALSGGAYFMMQNAEDVAAVFGDALTQTNNDATEAGKATGKYSGGMFHIKADKPIGPGTFSGWINFKSVEMDGLDDRTNMTELWLMYKYTVYKSELGSFSLSPTFRRMMQNTGDVEYARNKIELTMHLTFK